MVAGACVKIAGGCRSSRKLSLPAKLDLGTDKPRCSVPFFCAEKSYRTEAPFAGRSGGAFVRGDGSIAFRELGISDSPDAVLGYPIDCVCSDNHAIW